MDFNKIGLLLHIEEKVRQHPKFRAIHDAVMAELGDHSTEASEMAVEKAKKAAEESKAKAEEEGAKRAEEARKAEEAKPSKQEVEDALDQMAGTEEDDEEETK